MSLGTIGLWIARVAKVLALLAFFVPWVAVSCNGQLLAEASGYQLATGQIELPDMAVAPEGLSNAWWALLAMAVIGAGLLAGLVIRKSVLAGRIMAVTSLAALALVFGGMTHTVLSMRGEVQQKLDSELEGKNSLERQFAQMLGQSMRVEINVMNGYWLAISGLALAAAGGIAAGVAAGRKNEGKGALSEGTQ